MKKSRNSNNNYKQIQYSGPSFSDLPKDITLNIFFRLFIRSIFVCKSVCRTWHDLISDHEFAKLYYDETCDQVYPLIHTSESTSQSEMLYLVDLDSDDFNAYSNCEGNASGKLNTQLIKLPFCDFEMVSNEKYYGYKGIHCISNSCNGLICLSHRTLNRPAIICNPITSEFINLPQTNQIDECRVKSCGFGLSHLGNQYKVVRVIVHKNRLITAEVHTIGTNSWRCIGTPPQYIKEQCPAYSNGFLYWSSHVKPSLVSLNIDNECFGLVSGPEADPIHIIYKTDIVRVLGGELYMTLWKSGFFDVWTGKGYDVDVLSKFISTEMLDSQRIFYVGAFNPIKYLNDGSLLMFCAGLKAIVQFDLNNRRFRLSKIWVGRIKVEAVVAHIPSLVSLKQSLSGHNVKVLKS